MIRKKKPILNDDAQAAIIYLYVVGTVMLLGLFIFISPVMDAMTEYHNNATQGPNPTRMVSQNSQDSIFITQLAYRDWPIIAWILLTIAAYAAALKYRSQNL